MDSANHTTEQPFSQSEPQAKRPLGSEGEEGSVEKQSKLTIETIEGEEMTDLQRIFLIFRLSFLHVFYRHFPALELNGSLPMLASSQAVKHKSSTTNWCRTSLLGVYLLAVNERKDVC